MTNAELTDSVRATAEMLLAKARKYVTSRKGLVLLFAYATREAIRALSPDEQSLALRASIEILSEKDV